MRLVGVLDRNHRVTMAPYQKPGVPEAHGLSLAQCKAVAGVVTLDSNRYTGAAAINFALSVALGTSPPMRLYQAHGIEQLQDAVYDWVARNRGCLPGDTSHCKQYPDECRQKKSFRAPKEHRRSARHTESG